MIGGRMQRLVARLAPPLATGGVVVYGFCEAWYVPLGATPERPVRLEPWDPPPNTPLRKRPGA